VAFGNAAPDKILGHAFLLCDRLHLFGYDAMPGILNNTHTLPVPQKDKIKARFYIPERNLACLGDK
jgi:hypothetical protein